MSTAGCTRRVPDRLVLMRHAKSDYPPGVADHDRPLSARGRRDAAVASDWLRQHRARLVTGELTVLVSSATRAQETWAIAGAGLVASFTTEPRLYEACVSTIIDVATAYREGTVMVVGHNPTLEDCVRHLAAGAQAITMKTCTIAALDLDPVDPWSSGTAVLRELEVPRAAQP